MKIGIASDHGGFALKQELRPFLESMGHEITDFGSYVLDETDDYPDFVIPLAKALAEHAVDRGFAICGSGVGATIAANKVAGVRACLITDHFSAHQGVEDDDMNLLCLGGRITGHALAREIAQAFLEARFSLAKRHLRRVNKVKAIEKN